MYGLVRKFLFLSLMTVSFLAQTAFALKGREAKNELPNPLYVPYERPIGFGVNLGGILSGTLEGRFHLGLARNISLVAAPSYQATIELPAPNIKKQGVIDDIFSFKRLHLGAGIRAHFYEYDSWDGWFIEGMGRAGMTWVDEEDSVWSVIPSFMIGYGVVYNSGYSVSFGLGAEYEFLLGNEEEMPARVKQLKSRYWGITKLPLMGEISVGWTW